MNEIQRSIFPIIKGYTIYIITSIATVIVAVAMIVPLILTSVAAAAADINPLVGMNVFALFSGMMIYLLIILAAMIVMFYGLYMVYKGLKSFGPKLDAVGAAAVNNISIGVLVSMISNLVALVPFGGILALCGMIVSIVFTVMGYSALRGSASLTEQGKVAAKKLFQAIVFYLIAIGCVLIPILGWMVIPVFVVLYWVYLLKGWMMMRDSFATVGCEVPNALSDHQ